MNRVKNWAKTFQFNPKYIHSPKSEEEFQQLIKTAKDRNHRIRPRGSRHSWNPLIETSDISLSFQQWSGIERVNGKKVWVKSGTKICDLGRELFKHGLSLKNQGDVDSQTISGAISTGTHGTGLDLQNISGQVTGIRILTANGTIKEITKENEPLFNAYPISLGYLGIVLSYEIECMESPILECKIEKKSWDLFLETWEECSKINRHYEAFHFPYTNEVISKTTNISTTGEIRPIPFSFLNHGLIENTALGFLSKIAKLSLNSSKFSSKFASRFVSGSLFSDHSYKVFPSYRWIKFQEMEVALPFESALPVLKEIKKMIDKNNYQVHFPIEIRSVKSDELWLSPAYQRDSVYIAVHMYRSMEYLGYFKDLENLFLSAGGRPHWGKTHTQSYESLKSIVPRLNDFKKICETEDPDGLFRNDLSKKWFNFR